MCYVWLVFFPALHPISPWLHTLMLLSVSACSLAFSHSQPLLLKPLILTHKHTPLLSYTSILHNSNSAFILLLLFHTWSAFSFPFFYPLILSFHGISNPPFHHITFFCISLWSSLPRPFTVFNLSVQMAICSLLALSFCNPNIFATHARREKHVHLPVCHTQLRHQSQYLFEQNLQIQMAGYMTDCWRIHRN